MTALIIAGVVLCVCIFAAMATAPHCEPVELHKANEAERAALRLEAEEAHRTYHGRDIDTACLANCSETGADACVRCIAAKYWRDGR